MSATVESSVDASLWEASMKGDLTAMAERLGESDTDIDMFEEAGRTALHVAISCKKFFSAQFLIQNGANVNLRDKVSFE